MKRLLAILIAIALMLSLSVTVCAEEATTNITLVLTDIYGDGWETVTIKACLVKSDGSEEILMEGMTVTESEATYEFTVDKFAVVRFYWVGTEGWSVECGVIIKRDGHIQYEQLKYEEITDGALICSSEHFDPRSTTVTYSVAPAYTVTIPETVTIGAEGTEKTISAEDVVVEKGQYVSVSLDEDNNFTVKTAEGAELAYTVAANGEAVAAGGEILAVNPKNGKNGTATVTFDIDETKIQYAGTYTGTATFTIAVKNVPLINFTFNGTAYQAEEGMTLCQWAESEYDVNDKYYDAGDGTVKVKGNWSYKEDAVIVDGGEYLTRGG